MSSTSALPPSSTHANDPLAPSLAWSQQHGIQFVPSIMPRWTDAGVTSSDLSLRDSSAESVQRNQIRRLALSDLSLLLRLPQVEFFSHALYNKSLGRFIQSFLTQIQGVWQEVGGTLQMWQSKEDEADGGEEEKKSSDGAAPSSESTEELDVIRGILKRVLLVYVRLCSIDPATNPLLAGSSGATPAWLTPLFFTTSFSASSLFTASAILDLVTVYSSIDAGAHRFLLQFILDTVYARLSYAFTQGMTQAIGVITQILQSQVKLIHAPYASNSTSVKKARFVRGELGILVRNLTSLLFTLYSICDLRPELLRLLVQGVPTDSSGSVKSSPSNPPFLAVLTALYTETPLIFLHELGVKYAQLSAQPELMRLRRGCMMLVRLVFARLILSSMGLRFHQGRWSWVPSSKESGTKEQKLSSTAATTASTLPPPLTQAVAAELLISVLLLLNSTVTDDARHPEALCFLPQSMKNLVSYNTASTQNALLKRYNEYFELDTLLFFLHAQALSSSAPDSAPGKVIGAKKIEQVLGILQQIDPPLIKQRIGWPLPSAKSTSSVPARKEASSFEDDGEERKSSAPLTKQKSQSGNNVDVSLAISSLHDLFPHLSTDYIAACLSEYNNSTEETTNAILQEKLPQYLQDVKDKSRYKAGDHQDRSKLKASSNAGFLTMSRQSSTGSNRMLDQPVDDEDALIDRIGSEATDDDPDGFEAFLKRTGRVAKGAGAASSTAPKGAEMMLNSFNKAEALTIANKINARLKRWDENEDEYDDGYDDFESFALDDTPLEIEEHAAERVKSLYDDKFDESVSSSTGAGDEPDGVAYQPTGKYAGGPGARSMRGGAAAGMRGGARGGRTGSSAARTNFDNIQVPKHFMPDPNPSSDVREQWRRDEERKEVYIATLKAQQAQALPPSRRTPEQAADYEYGLRYGLIKNPEREKQEKEKEKEREQAEAAPKREAQAEAAPSSQQQTQKGQRGKNLNSNQSNRDQQQQRPRNENQPSQDASQRGGFSARGGRGGGRGVGGSNVDSSSQLSATASAFVPSSARPTSAQQGGNQSQRGPSQQQRQPREKASWDDESDEEQRAAGGRQDGGQAGGSSDSSADESQSQQQGGQRGGDQRQSGQPMDAHQRRRKEANKARSANHNRKAGALKKQGIKF